MPALTAARAAQVRAFMPSQGYENCGNATLVAARAVPSPLGRGASSASVPSLDLAAATFLELKFAAFGRCAARHPQPVAITQRLLSGHLHDSRPVSICDSVACHMPWYGGNFTLIGSVAPKCMRARGSGA